MSTHTPGRLTLELVESDTGTIKHLCPVDAEGMSLLTVVDHDEKKFAAVYNDHDARRLVACWNACKGIQTYQLELMVGDLSIENQIKCAASRRPAGKKTAYRIQRDELLAAAQTTLANNLHLADGDNCTLIDLKRAVERITRVAA